MTSQPAPHVPEKQNVLEAGRYFRYMAEFVGFSQADSDAIRETALVIEKHLPAMIGDFYTNLLQYPPTRRFFLKPDGSVDHDYLQLRMYHQANFWRRVAGGVYDDDFAGFVDYVGRAHTSRGADPRIYIAERYVIGMVGFIQHAVIEALNKELHEYDPDLETRAIKAWNKICMVILEMLARAYGSERDDDMYTNLMPVDPQAVHAMSVDSYEKGLGLHRKREYQDVFVARVDEIPVGERKIITTNGLSIGVFHHKERWFAIRNSCLHRGGPVATGELMDDNIVCPWHGYTYNLTNGELLMDPSAKLEMYPVTVQEDQVFVRVPLAPEPLMSEPPAPEPARAQPSASAAASPPPRTLQENEFRLADLQPGQVRLVHLDGQPVAVYNVDGAYYATQDECTHAGGPLSEGELQGKEITCPWHFSCFDVTTGAVTCAPATEPLQTLRVETDGEIGRVLLPEA